MNVDDVQDTVQSVAARLIAAGVDVELAVDEATKAVLYTAQQLQQRGDKPH